MIYVFVENMEAFLKVIWRDENQNWSRLSTHIGDPDVYGKLCPFWLHVVIIWYEIWWRISDYDMRKWYCDMKRFLHWIILFEITVAIFDFSLGKLGCFTVFGLQMSFQQCAICFLSLKRYYLGIYLHLLREGSHVKTTIPRLRCPWIF